MTETLLLSRKDIESILGMPTCIDIVEQVFRAHGEGNAIMPPKIKLIMKEKSGWVNAMPGYLKDIDAAGLKWVGGWTDNPSKGLPYIVGEIFLIDPGSGLLKAVLEGGYITNLRTGAATAVAAKYLARRDAGTITIIGAGAQGYMQLRALHCVFPVEDVRVTDYYPESAKQFAESMSAELGIAVQPVNDIEAAVNGADIIITSTTADEALIRKSWVSPGTFIASVGTYPELDPELVLKADKVIVDSWAQNCTRGELFRLIEADRIARVDIHGEMGEVVAGTLSGRDSDRELIIASLVGLGTHDVACAAQVVELALRKGLGTFFDFQQTEG